MDAGDARKGNATFIRTQALATGKAEKRRRHDREWKMEKFYEEIASTNNTTSRHESVTDRLRCDRPGRNQVGRENYFVDPASFVRFKVRGSQPVAQAGPKRRPYGLE